MFLYLSQSCQYQRQGQHAGIVFKDYDPLAGAWYSAAGLELFQHPCLGSQRSLSPSN